MKVKIVGKALTNKGVCYHCVEDTPDTNKHVAVAFTTDNNIAVGDICFVYSYCYKGNWYKKLRKV